MDKTTATSDWKKEENEWCNGYVSGWGGGKICRVVVIKLD